MIDLIKAVAEQMGYDYQDNEFWQAMSDVRKGGAEAGYGGFTYYTDTCGFFCKHRHMILTSLLEDVNEMGHDSIIDLMRTFPVLRDWGNDSNFEPQVGSSLYGPDPENLDSEIDIVIQNTLAWYALERVALWIEGINEYQND